ncbi:MAG: hypothetical protein D8M58_13130 [Calditrichaeota bacterium]|nr:MAG: hypothetical protein DWQ03_13915 [Calditrichota bacterium]MBL1206343.1 hypothetical protein [Calditrichota bacterium]NOG46169.1 alginate lyase family protein [Calditrichota bacterium]
MALSSKFKKIFRMSVAELRFRIWEQIRIRREKANAENELKTVSNPEFNFFENGKGELFKKYSEGDLNSLFFDKNFIRTISEPLNENKKEEFKKQFPEEYTESIKRADTLLKNEFAFLGVKFTLPDPIPWQSDPVSLNPYPQGFYRNINIFTNENAGDIKHVWEVNRLQYLIELSKAYYLSDEEKYKNKFDALILDWVEKNPYKMGVAWASALEVGVRATALVWALHFYMAGSKQDVNVVKNIIKLLYLCGTYLSENLSIYFSPYNHLIGETAGLFMVGYLFPGFKEAAKWEKQAWDILADQAGKQFHSDGASVEQATFYHHFTLGFYLQAIALKNLNNDLIPDALKAQVEKALEFAMIMTKPDGTLPYMGDIDDARSIYFRHPTNWNFLSYQTMGSIWFNRSDMKYTAKKFQEEAFWMLSDDEQNIFHSLKSQSPERSTVFLEESGYNVFRSGYGNESHYSHMDCGPIAHGVFHDETPSAAHGHADLLAIELAAFGDSYLVDPGFSNYRGDFDWHCYFRSTAAHNTIELNGESQAKQGGILVWSHAPKYKVLQQIDGNLLKGVCAEHYGYVRQEDKPIHRRHFAFVDKTFWVVFDEIYSNESSGKVHSVKPHFHFNNDIDVNINDEKNIIEAKGQKSSLSINMFSFNDAEIKLLSTKGGKNAEDGWISPTYRAVEPASVVSAEVKTQLPLKLISVYVPNLDTAKDKLEISTDENDIIVSNSTSSYKIHLYKDEKKKLVTQGYELWGDVVITTKGDKKKLTVLNLKTITKNGMENKSSQYIFEMEQGEQ